MDTSKERKLIEETFVLAFASSLQVEVPSKEAVDHFVSFVISRQKMRSFKEVQDSPPLLLTSPIDERFIYSSIPPFINYLQECHQ